MCRAFDASIGFHSGSGKSAENYQVMGAVTGGHLEIKTSGRYTYEMGVALCDVEESCRMRRCGATGIALRSTWRWPARSAAMPPSRRWRARSSRRRWASAGGAVLPKICSIRRRRAARCSRRCRRARNTCSSSSTTFSTCLPPAAVPTRPRSAITLPAGYAQRARFYAISHEARLNFAKAVADYIVFLAATTGLVEANRCATAAARLERYTSLEEMLAEILCLAQRDHGIYGAGSARWHVARHESGSKEDKTGDEHHGQAQTHLCRRACFAWRGRARTLPRDLRPGRPSRASRPLAGFEAAPGLSGAERHAEPDLRCPLRDRKGHHPINAKRRQ